MKRPVFLEKFLNLERQVPPTKCDYTKMLNQNCWFNNSFSYQ
jgi:hypothetical protein